ncbi:MAG: hypothetical protein KF690_09925 [Bacteroidetes bacterium]|nr:hypothetical protein [Bacteroidota bacterium]
MKVKLILLGLCCILAIRAKAQQLDINSTHELTGKSKRGYLGKVIYDEASETTDLIFVTKATESKVKMEHYFFDKEYKFLRMEEDIIELEKANAKYKWFKYRGENYSKEWISVESNLVGTLVLKRKRADYKWSWWDGGYNITIKLLEKLKPRNEDGGKYFVYNMFDNLATGNTMVLTGAKPAKGETNAFKQSTEFEIVEVTPDLDVIVKDKFKFDYPMTIVYSSIVSNPGAEDEGEAFTDANGNVIPDLSTGDLVLLMAPADVGMKKANNPNAKAYTYLRINSQGKVIARVDIPSATSTWGIYQAFNSGQDIYLLGPTQDKAYYNMADKEKWTGFQLAKISGGKLVWVTNNNMDDFEARLQTPPSQKRAPAYKGKKFHYTTSLLTSKGEIFVAGQNLNTGGETIDFTDVLLFHFDNQGKLRAQYGGRRNENNKYAKANPTTQNMYESTDGSKVYWMIAELKDIRTTTEAGSAAWRPLIYPNIAAINLNSATIGDFTAYGLDEGGKQAYFLHNRFPVMMHKKANAIVFLGESKNEKTLWFGRLRF